MPVTGNHIKDALAKMEGISISATDAVFDELATRLNATNEYQKDHYQGAWSEKTTRFEEARAESATLEQLIDHVGGVPSTNGVIISVIAENDIKIDNGTFSPVKGQMVVARDGQYEMVPNTTTDSRLVDAVLAATSENTEAIVELGCGWGHNLARAALKTTRRDMTFIGLEQAADGLRCTDELLSKDNSVLYQTHHFDFYDPDFSSLEGKNDIVVFSCAALEQILLIGSTFIDDIMAIADNVTLVFYEPIGWQRNPDHLRFATHAALSEIMGNNSAEIEQVRNYTFNLSNNALAVNAIIWSVAAKYNLNLWSVIQDAIARQVIEQEHATFDIFGLNPFNPYSLVVLKKRDQTS